MTDLVKLERATQMLAEVRDAGDAKGAKQIKDAAQLAEMYARKQKAKDSELYAHGIKIDAGAVIGEVWLRDGRKKGEKTAKNKSALGGGFHRKSLSRTAFCKDIGTSDKELRTDVCLAKIRTEDPNAYTAVRNMEKTVTEIIRAEKESKRWRRRRENAEKVAAVSSVEKVEGLFSTIVVDPPWDWGDEGDVNQLGRARPDFAGMPFDKLLAFPIESKAAEDAHIYLWITNRSLPKGFALLDAWGFRYVTCLTWCKPSFGQGNYFRGQTEHVLFGIRGSLKLKRKDVGNGTRWRSNGYKWAIEDNKRWESECVYVPVAKVTEAIQRAQLGFQRDLNQAQLLPHL